MTIVTTLRELCRLRLLVAVVLVIAVLAGVAVAYKLPALKPRQHEVGVATTQILLDTPSSQVVDIAPKGSDTTGVRANLLASLMVDGNVRAAIAQAAGLQPDQIGGTSDAASTSGSASGSTGAAAPAGPTPYLLTTHILTDSLNEPLPIIEVDVQAPTAAGAANLAAATVTGLSNYLSSTAATEKIPDANRLQINGLGVPQATTEAQGPSKAIALPVGILVFVLGCAATLGVRALVRTWRADASRERLAGGRSSAHDGGVVADEPVDLGGVPGAPAPVQAPAGRVVAGTSDNGLAPASAVRNRYWASVTSTPVGPHRLGEMPAGAADGNGNGNGNGNAATPDGPTPGRRQRTP